jgi:hypothetical protein
MPGARVHHHYNHDARHKRRAGRVAYELHPSRSSEAFTRCILEINGHFGLLKFPRATACFKRRLRVASCERGFQNMTKSSICASLLAVVFASGCATLFQGTNEEIMVQSDPPGAQVSVNDGRNGTTPR